MVHCKLCASDEIWFAYLITVISKVEVKILQRSELVHFPLGSQHSCFAHWLILPALLQLTRVTQRWAYSQATTKTKEKPIQDCVSGLVYPEEPFIRPLQEEDLSIVHTDRQERSKSDSIKTSTPALFSTPGIKRRPNTSIFGEPLPMTEASTSRGANTSRPQLFMSLSETRPQPFSLPASRPSFSVSAFGSPLPVSFQCLKMVLHRISFTSDLLCNTCCTYRLKHVSGTHIQFAIQLSRCQFLSC